MFTLTWKKISNLFTYIISESILRLLFLITAKKREKTLLLIRLDAIGDYILFRNYLYEIRKSKKYSNYSMTLCGNAAWKDIAETFDKDVVDNFIWLNTKKFYSNIIYKYKILKNIRESGFETVIEATYSRAILFGDLIVKASDAGIRIGSTGSKEKHVVWKRKFFTDNVYTQLIQLSSDTLFEFYTNKELFSKILEYDIHIQKPNLDTRKLTKSERIQKDYILLFPGTNEKSRMWSSYNFKQVAEYLTKNYPYTIVLSGSRNEMYLYERIISEPTDRYLNFFGNTLPELAKLIADARLLISNDTSAIHFAVSTGTPSICISSGHYFGRFQPYPVEVFDKAFCIYPPKIMKELHNPEQLKVNYRYGSDCNINEVTCDAVIEKIKNILGPLDENRN